MRYEDIEKILASGKKIKERVHRMGVELEGGWSKVPKDVKLEHDGSVVIKIPATKVEDIYTAQQINEARMRGVNLPIPAGNMKPIHAGEIPSMILEPSQFADWVRKYYPDFVNETCGMHVHMSFTSALHYSRLMSPSFTTCVVSHFNAWAKKKGLPKSHPIWNRLAGKSQYCQPKFWADEQARKMSKDHNREGHGNRYTMISYPYSLKGTVECRLLPMMDNAELAVEAIKEVLNITNACLMSSGGIKGEKVSKRIDIHNGDEIYLESRRLMV